MMTFVSRFAVFRTIQCEFTTANIPQFFKGFTISALSYKRLLLIPENPVLFVLSHFNHYQ